MASPLSPEARPRHDAGMHVLIVGAGVFGVAAALALRGRGHDVAVLDPGPLPRPQGSSTDTSRAVRMDYGSDAFHTDLAAEAIDGWLRWGRELGVELLHLDGMAFLVTERKHELSLAARHDSRS